MEQEAWKHAKVYVGDGVYAERDGNFGIRLTKSHESSEEEIYLEWEVWRSLSMWVQAILERL